MLVMSVLYRCDSGALDSGSWVGGIVVKELVGDIDDAVNFLLAYDTGIMRTMTFEALKCDYEKKCLRQPPENAKGGLAYGTRVDECVVNVAWHRFGGRDPKPVGILIGNTGLHLFEEDQRINLCSSFYVHVAAWAPSGRVSARKKSAASSSSSVNERGSYRTFRRGDVVTYQVPPHPPAVQASYQCPVANTSLSSSVQGTIDCDAVEDATAVTGPESVHEAAVFAVCMENPDKPGSQATSKQRRKFLVLYDLELKVFFLAYFSSWARMWLEPAKESVLHIDESERVKVLAPEACVQMFDDWATDASLKLRDLRKISAGNSTANNPPPSLRAAQEQAKKEEKKRLQKEQQAAKKAHTEASKKAGKGCKAGGRAVAGRGGGNGGARGGGNKVDSEQGLSLIHI